MFSGTTRRQDRIPANATAQGFNFTGTKLAQDLRRRVAAVTLNIANLAANGSRGALLLHHHNASGNRAQAVAIEGTATADLSIGMTATPPSPLLGQNVTLTVQVSNGGPARRRQR